MASLSSDKFQKKLCPNEWQYLEIFYKVLHECLFLHHSFVELSIFILKLKTNMLFGSVSKTLSKIPIASLQN